MYKRMLAAAIIILIAFAYVQWGMDYIYAYEWEKTAPARDSLVNDVQNTRKIIDKPVIFDETLEERLGELNAMAARERDKFPSEVDITDLVDQLLRLAEANGVNIIPLSNGDWGNSRENGYERFNIQLIVTGNIDDIVSFIDRVEKTMLHSINIETMEVSGAIDQDEDAADEETVNGSITITVYARN